MNGAQTVEPRARSGGTAHYSDGTDAPRAPIVPNASYCPAPYVCVDSSGLFKGFYKFRSGPQKSCEVLDVVLVVSSWDPPPWGTQIITLPPDTAVPNMPKTPENGVCESL